uniref:Uncharacterized protein n=1 Tax=Onchocerca volvulus TaxID=6282 RepID=A0A8R1TRR9_ONCVO
MYDFADVNDFPTTFVISSIIIALPVVPVLILCQFKKMEKKKQAVLTVSHFPAIENNDSEFIDKKATNQTNATVVAKLKSIETMQQTGTPLRTKTSQSIEYMADNSLNTRKCNDQGGKNYQIIGDLDNTDSSYEYSLDNTLAMESLEKIRGKHDLILEGEEIDHQMRKSSQKSNSSDYSLFDSQTSRRDIREQRLRLLKLDTTVARRVAAALEDSEISISAQDKRKKPTNQAAQQTSQVEETQDKLVAHT